MSGDGHAAQVSDGRLAHRLEVGGVPPTIVSIVVATRNDLPRLHHLVTRTTAADLGPTEMVVVDGGSSDGTREWLAQLDSAGSVPIRWLSEPDGGIAEAWNRGVALARGEWVVFLGADDAIYDSGAWRRALAGLRGLSPFCGIALFPVAVVSPSGRLLVIEMRPVGPAAERLLAGEPIAHQGMFHRRCLWATCGGFDTSYRIAADYEFCLRACRAGVLVETFYDSPAVAMTFGGASKRNPLATLREVWRAQRSHGIPVSFWMRRAAWLRAALRWCGMKLLPPSVVGRCADAARRAQGLPPVWTVP